MRTKFLLWIDSYVRIRLGKREIVRARHVLRQRARRLTAETMHVDAGPGRGDLAASLARTGARPRLARRPGRLAHDLRMRSALGLHRGIPFTADIMDL